MASISKKQNRAAGNKSATPAGNRPGKRRSVGPKPGGTNLDLGGGSAAENARTGASAARGKGARAS